MAGTGLTEPGHQAGEQLGDSNNLPPSVDRTAVREQLDRILASPVFRTSRRNSNLLRHVVDRALEGRSDELKERNIGMDVFCRTADYDTNTDHVVRSVAGEVRRRLAQYYIEPGREDELRIDLQAGSYVPQFRLLVEKPTLTPGLASAGTPSPIAPGTAATSRIGRIVRWRFLAPTAAALLIIAWVLAVRFNGPTTAFERFWKPFFSSPNPALLCFGGGQASPMSDANLALPLTEFEHLSFRRMHTSDAMALAGIAGLLRANGKPYRIVNRAHSTSFGDLQSGPFVLIGAMNNEWTLRLTSGLRFSFERQPNGARVADKQNPSNVAWSVDFRTPVIQFNRDYAIVSRVRDPQTEQIAVIVAGIGSWGTLAAGEFVTRPEQLRKLDRIAPKHWERKNLQVVLATDVIRGSSGPPAVLTAQFW